MQEQALPEGPLRWQQGTSLSAMLQGHGSTSCSLAEHWSEELHAGTGSNVFCGMRLSMPLALDRTSICWTCVDGQPLIAGTGALHG